MILLKIEMEHDETNKHAADMSEEIHRHLWPTLRYRATVVCKGQFKNYFCLMSVNSKQCNNGKRYSISQQSQGYHPSPFHPQAGQGQGNMQMHVTTPILGMYVHVPMCPSEIVCRRAESATSESEREQTSRTKHSIHVFWSQRHRSKETSKWLEISNSKHDKRIDLQFIPNNSKWVPGVPSYLQMQFGA